MALSLDSWGRSHGLEPSALLISPHPSQLNPLLGTSFAGALPHHTHPTTAQPCSFAV